VSDSFVGELQGMLDGFREQRENMLKTQHAVAEISATATAPKHAFVVTVGAQGEISLANVAAGKPDWDKLGFDALPTTVDELLGGRFGSVDEAPEVGRGR
jgi:hypothetical protein